MPIRENPAIRPWANPRGFTLVELLVVSAVLAVLAATALPNLLEAQTRAKVARTMADLRSTATAIEAYAADWNRHPLYGVLNANGTLQNPHLAPAGAPAHKFLHEGITTPVAYMAAIFEDPFLAGQDAQKSDWRPFWPRYFYTNLDWFAEVMAPAAPPVIAQKKASHGPWILCSSGPDGDRLDLAGDLYYDPTNGTVSDGDIVRSMKRSGE